MTPAMQELLLYLVVVASVAGLACAYLRKDDQGDHGEQQGSGEAEAEADFDPLASFRGSIEEDVAAQRRAAAARLGKGALRDGHEL